MSIRDKQQKRGRQDEQAVNLAAIAQHQAINLAAPNVQQTGKTPAQVQQEIYGNPGGMTDAELQRSVHPVAPTQTIATADTEVKEMTTETNTVLETPTITPIRIMGESETTPSLDAAIAAGIINPTSEDVLTEIMTHAPSTDHQQVQETENDHIADKEENMETLSNKEVVKTWIASNPTINTSNLTNIKLSTITGAVLVTELGLPSTIPIAVAKAIILEMGEYPMLAAYQQTTLTVLPLLSNTEGDVDTIKALDLIVVALKPHLEKIMGMWTKFVGVIKGLITIPVEEVVNVTTTPVIIDTTPQVAEIKAGNQTISVSVTITDENKAKETQAEEPEVVVKGPEELLKEWTEANPGYSFDAYFNKRNELYMEASAN